MNRRAFLHLSASGAALSPALSGCSPDASPKPGTDTGLEAEPLEVTVTKGPWVTILGPGTVRLRFETFEDVAVPVVIHVDGTRSDRVTTTSTANISWAWGYDDAPTEQDLPGDYTLHDVVIDGIPTGATLEWELQVTGQPAGVCRPSPASTDPVTVCWMADTMYPRRARGRTGARHGARPAAAWRDFQYRSSPTDTWTAMFANLAPLLRSAVFQVCIGNHEFDAEAEESEL